MSRNQRILRALKEAGITQSALAKVLDVTLATVSARLNGEKEIDSYDFLAAVSRLTGRSIEWLAEGEGVESVVNENAVAYKTFLKSIELFMCG